MQPKILSFFKEHWFWPATAILLVLMASVQVTSSLQENQTCDESAHLVSGYSFWVKGDYRLSPEHPPLARLLAALPLLALRPAFPEIPELWDRADACLLGREFFYRNHIAPETLLLAGRSIIIAMTVALGLLLALWMRKEFSSAAAVFALALCAFDPNILAHGRYITTDLPVTLFFFASCLSWHDYLASPRRWPLYRTGLLVALALATKFNALLLIPAFALLYLTRRVKLMPRHALLALCLVPFLVIWGLYMFDTRSISQDPILKGKPTDVGLIQDLPVPGYYWLRGIHLLFRFDRSRPVAYLFENEMEGGSWLYFPVAFAVKTPVATLLLLLLAAIFGRQIVRKYPVLVVPPALFFLVTMFSSVNIGVRHILPIYPFLFALSGAALFQAGRRRVLQGAGVGLAGLLVVTSVAAYPDYLPFFNLAAGGPENGPKYLLDSNLDWGQDLLKLKRWSESRGTAPPQMIAYFGDARPSHFGMQAIALDTPGADDDPKRVGLVAISAHFLFGSMRDRYAWLREKEPLARVGHSIYVYDLGGHPTRFPVASTSQ